MLDLLPQPHQPYECQQHEGDHSKALLHVSQDVLRAEHVDGETQDGGDRASKEGAVDPAGCEWHHTQPSHGHQGVVHPHLKGPPHRG